MRAFFNIVIVGLIGLLSSTYLFNLSPVDYSGTIEIETPLEESTLGLEVEEDSLLNPESITIKHTASKPEVIKIVTDSIFNVDIYKDNELIKTGIKNLEPVSPSVNATISLDEDNPVVTSLNISQKHLGLEDGVYEFIFNSNLIRDKENSSLSVRVTYDTAGKYYPAAGSAPAGTKGLTLYFVAEDAGILIPLTRFVVEDKSITRMAIEQLQNGPLNKGFRSVIKNVTNTTYNNGNVVIDIPSSYDGYNREETESLLAYNSFLKTIFAVERYWPIHSVSFTVDRTRPETYFHGIDMNPVPNVENNYILYMAYKADERYYLFEHQPEPEQIGISANDTLEMKARKIFDAYSDTALPYAVSPVPKSVALKNASVERKTLILDFNEEFLKVYEDRTDLRQMMVESLVYTFTTIPGVDSIKITAQGKEISGFLDSWDMTKALYPPEFINPEIVETQEKSE
jgi:spore germination protein GerM